MKIGALIVTTGLPRVSGVASLLQDSGTVSAGQRMISAFQRAGVALTALVVGPEDKKAERQLAQNGVVFLRCEDAKSDFFRGLQRGLSFLQGKFDRVLVVPGDTPLFLPKTVEVLCRSDASIAVPENKHVNGFPIALDKDAVDLILNARNAEAAREAVKRRKLTMASLPVEDSGILLRSGDMTRRKMLIQQHNDQLSRPVVEPALYSGGLLYDSRLSMLLHLVEETRSVREACSLMQISYSAGWNMLNHVEDELDFPLVVRIRGGSAGSGSELTEKGRKLMDAYDRFSEHLNREARQLYGKLFENLAD